MKRLLIAFLFFFLLPFPLFAEEPVVVFKNPPTGEEVRMITSYTHRVFEFVAEGVFEISSVRILVEISPRTENFKRSKFRPASEWGVFLDDYEYMYVANWGSSPVYVACTIRRRATPLSVSGTFVLARLYVPGATYYTFRFLDSSVWDLKGLVRGARIFARDPSAKIRPSPDSTATTWGFVKSRL